MSEKARNSEQKKRPNNWDENEVVTIYKIENVSFDSGYFMQSINHYHVKLSSRCVKIRTLQHANSC